MPFQQTRIRSLLVFGIFLSWRNAEADGNFTVHHSPSQLSLPSTAEVIIIPGSELDTGTSNKNGRYECGNYTAVFTSTSTPLVINIAVNLADTAANDTHTATNGTHTAANDTHTAANDTDTAANDTYTAANDTHTAANVTYCVVNMGDESSSFTIFTVNGRFLTQSHTYPKFGVYKVTLECTSDLGTVFCPVQNDSCVVTSNFLDDSHVTFATPLKFFTTDSIQINSFMELTPGCGSPDIVWRITKIDADAMVDFDNFTQPGSSVFTLDPGVLTPGEYAVHLEIMFPTMGENYWSEDSMVIRVLYPELVAHIYGGNELYVPANSIITVDASRSFDPAGNLSEPLEAKWSFATANAGMTYEVLAFQSGFPFSPAPLVTTAYNIKQGTDFILQIDTSSFATYTVCLVVISLIRGTRESSALQVLFTRNTILPITIDCIYNCNLYREKRFNQDRIELDSVLPQEITETSQFTFSWYVYIWWGNNWAGISTPLTSTGLTSRSIGILKYQLSSGYTYKIGVWVIAPGYAWSMAAVIGTVNYPPLSGLCTMNTLVGVAARDWFVLTCTGWISTDERNSLTASNPYLTFVVRQYTKGAFVEEEPILQTRASESHLILKLGDPSNYYNTTVTVLVYDMYQDYVEIPIEMTANPAFAWYNVNASDYGAGIILQYTGVDYVYDEKQIRFMGKLDLLLPLVSSVCSHIHLISVIQDMVGVIRDMVDTYVVNGTRSSDKLLMSMVTNAFTNLAAVEQFVNIKTRGDLIYLSELTGNTALTPVENSAADPSAQTERMCGEIYNLSQAVVNSAVPNNLAQARIITDFLDSKKQIDDMLSVKGNGIDISTADLSPAERYVLYQRIQDSLQQDLQERKKQAKAAADMAKTLAKEVLDKLKVCKTCSNENSTLTKQLVRKNKADVIKTIVNRMEHSQFRVDGMAETLGNESVDTSLSAVEFTKNVFMYDSDTRSSFVTSRVLHIDVRAAGSFVSPEFVTYTQTVESTPELITPFVDPEDASEFSLHKFIYQSNSDNICIVVKPEDETNVTEYKIYIDFLKAPTILDYDLLFAVKAENLWRVCIEPTEMKGHQGVVYLAVNVPKAVRTVKYYFTLVTAGCLTWEETTTTWHTNKCQMTWISEFNQINCTCRNLPELTVANSFFVAPNTIDFSSVFLKFSPLNQAAVMGALGSLFLVYIVVVVIVIGIDRQDKLKWGITPLRDNIYGHDHYYIIKVFTGMRRGAGTCSRIAFNLFGDEGSTGPRELFDGVRQHFSTGSVMTLFMATKDDLGTLTELNIWHDNSGQGEQAPWYLNCVAVFDIARNETYTFVAESWLSIETTLEVRLDATNTDKPPEFENRFFRQTRDRLSESHMWVSILYRPMASSFTRVQRASCALVYICLTMIANAMYFNPDPNYSSPPLVQIGPFRFTGQQMFVSLVCALITTPVVMFLIFLFKRTKPWPSKPSRNVGRGCDSGCQCACAHVFKRLRHFLFHSRKKERRHQYEAELGKRLLSKDVPDIEGGLRLHHSFIVLAWLLVLAGTVVPAFFIVLYSMEWGQQKSEEWLTAFLLSVFESAIFVDPLMVICLSLVFACLCRKVQEHLTVDTEALIDNYKRWMGETAMAEGGTNACLQLLQSATADYRDDQALPRRVTKSVLCLEHAKVEEYRHQQKLSAMLRDLLLNLFVMTVVFSICYSNRTDMAYYHHRDITNNLLTPTKLPHFNKTKSRGDLFTWLNKTAIPYLFPEDDWNGDPLAWTTRQFTSGFYTFRLGPPRLRQLRIKKDTCNIPYMGEMRCYGAYEFFDEDDREFCVGWSGGPCSSEESVTLQTLPAWKHVAGTDVWGLPITGELATYSGGGYMTTMYVDRNTSNGIVNELYEMLWMDRQTRAVFLEFTLYCAETNIFIHNVFLTEFPPTGAAFTTHSVYPMRLYTHQGPVGTFTLICDVMFVIVIMVLLVKTCIRLYQQRCSYFKRFWQSFELLMVLVGLSAIVLFAFRLLFTNRTIGKFKEDVALFVNFSHIAFWDQMFVLCMAILAFMATMRVLEVFSTSKKVNAVVKVFKDCGSDLFWFGTTFFYILLGFCGLASILFGAHLYSYMNVYMSMRTLFLALLGSTHYSELNAIQPILAKVFFVLYVMAILFFVMTIFASILCGSIDSIVHDTREDKREDLIEHVLARIKALISKPVSRARIYQQTT